MLGNKYLAAVIGVLLTLVILYNIQFFRTKGSPVEVPAMEKTERAGSSEIKTEKSIERIYEKEDKRQWKHDPFNIKVTEKEPDYTKAVHLMGIIKRDVNSHALLNGKFYSVNDKIGDGIIKEIKRHSIVLLSGGKEHVISFDDYTVLKENIK